MCDTVGFKSSHMDHRHNVNQMLFFFFQIRFMVLIHVCFAMHHNQKQFTNAHPFYSYFWGVKFFHYSPMSIMVPAVRMFVHHLAQANIKKNKFQQFWTCIRGNKRCPADSPHTWWRHQMETFSALLAICAGNSPVPGEFPTQRPVTRSFDVFFDLRLNKRLSKHSWAWWFETLSPPLWRHRNDRRTVMWPSCPCENVIICIFV